MSFLTAGVAGLVFRVQGLGKPVTLKMTDSHPYAAQIRDNVLHDS